MKKLFILAAAFLVTACDKQEVVECEKQLLAKLKSPASYKRVDVTVLEDKGKVELIFIDYDAANSYGAIMRGEEVCNY